jgi:hypothetical protein
VFQLSSFGIYDGDFLDLCFRLPVVACRMMSDYKVEMVNDGMQEFFVEFRGPNESTDFWRRRPI